jgi:acyl transferase domain-containing protein
MLADLSGEKVEDGSVFNAQYWTAHLSQPVQFARCLDRLEAEGCSLCIEMGPRAVLSAIGKERNDTRARWVASANGRAEDFEALQSALAEAFVAGAELNWRGIFNDQTFSKVALPTYPFERERYWIGNSSRDTETDRGSSRKARQAYTAIPPAMARPPVDAAPVNTENHNIPSWLADPGEDRLAAIELMVRKESARILGLRGGELPVSSMRLADLGFDSLMAVTLRNRLQAITGHTLPTNIAFEFPTSAEIAAALEVILGNADAAFENGASLERDEIQI